MLGYTNIKIYNGGIKDWSKSGLPLDTINPLPQVESRFLGADQLFSMIQAADAKQCIEEDGLASLTILDFRNENFFDMENPPPRIQSQCQTIFLQLDDIRKPEIRKQIPLENKVVTITETGNRDDFAMRYLSKFGYSNIVGLQFGMRGWLKMRYPIETKSGQ